MEAKLQPCQDWKMVQGVNRVFFSHYTLGNGGKHVWWTQGSGQWWTGIHVPHSHMCGLICSTKSVWPSSCLFSQFSFYAQTAKVRAGANLCRRYACFSPTSEGSVTSSQSKHWSSDCRVCRTCSAASDAYVCQLCYISAEISSLLPLNFIEQHAVWYLVPLIGWWNVECMFFVGPSHQLLFWCNHLGCGMTWHSGYSTSPSQLLGEKYSFKIIELYRKLPKIGPPSSKRPPTSSTPKFLHRYFPMCKCPVSSVFWECLVRFWFRSSSIKFVNAYTQNYCHLVSSPPLRFFGAYVGNTGSSLVTTDNVSCFSASWLSINTSATGFQ